MRRALRWASLLGMSGLSMVFSAAPAQTPAPGTPAATATPAAGKTGVTPGVPLPTGLGFFANPDNYHRLTLGLQAGLGVSANSETFGYDNLAISSKWKLGTNALGRHLNALVGFSDWRTPAYRKVFTAQAIDPLPNQDRFAAQSANAASLGLSFAGGREPWQPTDAQKAEQLAYHLLIDSQLLPTLLLNSPASKPGANFNTYRTPSEDLVAALLQAAEAEEKRLRGHDATLFDPIILSSADRTTLVDALKKLSFNEHDAGTKVDQWAKGTLTKHDARQLDSLRVEARLISLLASTLNSAALKSKWLQQANEKLVGYQRSSIRAFSYAVGALTRFASFAEETKLQAFDSYLTLSQGNRSLDVVLAAHYLRYLDNSLPRYATTIAAGLYADLKDDDIFPVLGLTAGYGYYAFQELHDVVAEAPALAAAQDPFTKRLDIVLSVAGAPDKTNTTGAGFGVRYSHINPHLLPSYNAFSLVFSTNFSLIK